MTTHRRLRKNASTGVSEDGRRLTDQLGEDIWYHGSRYSLATGAFERPSSAQDYDATFFTNSRDLAESFTEGLGSELLAVRIKPIRLLDPDNLFVQAGTDNSLTAEGVRFVQCLAQDLNESEVTDICKGLSLFKWGVFDPEQPYYHEMLSCIRDLGYRGWVEKELSRFRSTPVISVALLFPEEDVTLLWRHAMG
jgi:hypothetical protein